MIFLYDWLPIGGYHKNMVIWKFYFIFQNLAKLGQIFHGKSFV